MRTNILLIILSLLLVATASVCVVRMHKTSHELMQAANAVAQALPDDPPLAEARLDSFTQLWTSTEPRWQFIAIHEDLEKIDDTLLCARNALEFGDLCQAKQACLRLPDLIESIMKKEQPTLGNLF